MQDNTVTIYRVEDEDGRGYYSSYKNAYVPMPNSWDRHPVPEADGIDYPIDAEEFFGFQSVSDLNYWFDGIGEALTRAGWVVVVYSVEIEYVRFGGCQVVFYRDLAQQVKKVDPHTLIEG